MFTTVAKNIGKLLLAYMSLIVGFSFGFAVLFPDVKSFAYMPGALLTTLVMMTGELEYNQIFYGQSEYLKFDGTTQLVFMAFLLFIVIILMNLLVGLAVSDIQGLQNSAGLDRLVRQVRLSAQLENFIFFPWLNRFPCWAKALSIFKKTFLVVEPGPDFSLTFRPNDPRDSRFPSDIKEGLLNILVQDKTAKKFHRISLN